MNWRNITKMYLMLTKILATQMRLKCAGRKENSIVVYISDSCIAFPGAETTLYEPDMKLASFIEDLSIGGKGTASDAPTSQVDLTATTLDIAEEYYPR